MLEDLDKNMFCRMVNLFDGFPTLILLKVSSSLLPVLITQKLVANADSQDAPGISTCRNQTKIQVQIKIQKVQTNKKTSQEGMGMLRHMKIVILIACLLV